MDSFGDATYCYGGIQHLTIDALNEQQLWADTIFMTVLFLAKLASVTNDRRFAEKALHQFLLHIHYLQDRKNGTMVSRLVFPA